MGAISNNGFPVVWNNGEEGQYIIQDSFIDNQDENTTDVDVEELDCGE